MVELGGSSDTREDDLRRQENLNTLGARKPKLLAYGFVLLRRGSGSPKVRAQDLQVSTRSPRRSRSPVSSLSGTCFRFQAGRQRCNQARSNQLGASNLLACMSQSAELGCVSTPPGGSALLARL